MNSEDADVERYLKLLTLLHLDEIADILSEHKKSPELRI
jgi:tyrosyl-tRNA synthetase